MKRKIIIALCVVGALALIVGATLLIIYLVKLGEYKKMDIKLSADFTYTAHTGCCNTDDNSLESIDVAVSNGADIVEFDIYYNGKEHVLSHDAPKGGEVTLREAFALLKEYDGLRANVDVKDTTEIAKVQELAQEMSVLDRIFFTGIEAGDVKAVQEGCPLIPYYLNMTVISPDEHADNYYRNIAKNVKQRGAIGINFSKENATRELVECFHNEGLLVSVWTVNDTLTMYEMLSYGVDNITTRRPDKMQEIITEIGE